MVNVLARKLGLNPNTIKSKISETVKMISEAKTEISNVRVLGHDLYNPHSLFLSEDIAMITPYFVSRGRRQVPLFRYRNVGGASYYQQLRDDIHNVIEAAADISEYSFDD
jgi:hypothetical protein